MFICLGENGLPKTCVRQLAQRFEYSKARNILVNLPKSLKRLNFKVSAVPDEFKHEEKEVEIKKAVVISTHNTISDNVTRWVDRVKNCNDLAKDASKRKRELEQEISNVDKELSNCLHIIELTNWKNGCDGYKEYKMLKTVLEKRRCIKDEFVIIQSILSSNIESIATSRMEKLVKGLENRIFSVRDVETYASE